jgi:hypothetical protein
MQIAFDTVAVRAFNKAAPTLASTFIAGRRFELIRDYWHNKNGWKSCIVREVGTNDIFPITSNAFPRRGRNADNYRTWLHSAVAMHCPDQLHYVVWR